MSVSVANGGVDRRSCADGRGVCFVFFVGGIVSRLLKVTAATHYKSRAIRRGRQRRFREQKAVVRDSVDDNSVEIDRNGYKSVGLFRRKLVSDAVTRALC